MQLNLPNGHKRLHESLALKVLVLSKYAEKSTTVWTSTSTAGY